MPDPDMKKTGAAAPTATPTSTTSTPATPPATPTAPPGYRWTTEGAPPGQKILVDQYGNPAPSSVYGYTVDAVSRATTGAAPKPGDFTPAPGAMPTAAGTTLPSGEVVRDYSDKPRALDSASSSYQAAGVAAGAAPTSMEALGTAYTSDLRGFANWMVDQKEAGKLGDLPMYSREKVNTMTEAELKAFMDANPKMAASYFGGAGKPSEAARATPYGTGESGEVVVPTAAPTEKPPIELGDGKPTPGPASIPAPQAIKEAADVVKEEEPDTWKKIGSLAADLGMTALGLFQAFAMGQANITDPEKIWTYREAAKREREKVAESEKAEKEKERAYAKESQLAEQEWRMKLEQAQADLQINLQNSRNAAEVALAKQKFANDMALLNASKGGATLGAGVDPFAGYIATGTRAPAGSK